MMRSPGFAALFSALALAGCSPQTHSLTDTSTGLAVSIAGEYLVEPWPLQPPYTAMIAIKGKDGHPFIPEDTVAPICVAAFQPMADNASLSQAELNAAMPEFAGRMETEFGGVMRIEAREPFESRGLAGFRLVTTPLGTFTAKVRIVLYVMETPRGRTVVNCSANAETLTKAMPTYDLIRDGVTAP